MNSRNLGTNEAHPAAPRRSYSVPRLIEYGSLESLTQTIKEGAMTDAGGPGGGKTIA